MESEKTIGAVTWTDLTVSHADQVRDFYKKKGLRVLRGASFFLRANAIHIGDHK